MSNQTSGNPSTLWQRVVGFFRRCRNRVQAPTVTLQIEQSGLCRIHDDGSVQRLAWQDVIRIVAFKRDLMTVDQICVAFEQEGEWLEVDEDCDGFRELLTALAEEFALSPMWYVDIMSPAFAPNITVLWEREGVGVAAP